jgi:hypothetical protein
MKPHKKVDVTSKVFEARKRMPSGEFWHLDWWYCIKHDFSGPISEWTHIRWFNVLKPWPFSPNVSFEWPPSVIPRFRVDIGNLPITIPKVRWSSSVISRGESIVRASDSVDPSTWWAQMHYSRSDESIVSCDTRWYLGLRFPIAFEVINSFRKLMPPFKVLGICRQSPIKI